MSLPQRRWLHHTPPGWVKNDTYFITLCCQLRGTDQLCTATAASRLLSAVEHYHLSRRWYVSLWLLMPDHLHAIASFPPDASMAGTIAAWKRYTAREAGIAWQKGFFDHRLRQNESFLEKADYIRMNPVRQGLVLNPDDWPHVWPKESDIHRAS